ncbi:MAG: TetR/AcrR family transcriptional regulator [bacterium]
MAGILGRVSEVLADVDPRVRRSREAVLAASVALFVAGGPRSVTVDAVSEASGVAKTTIYRHWRDRAHLLADTYRACLPVSGVPSESLDSEQQLRDVVRSLVRGMGVPPTRPALPHLIATPLDPVESRALPADVLDQTFAPLVAAIKKAATSGVIPQRTDTMEAKHQIVGFIIMSAIDPTCAMDDELADRITALFVAGRQRQLG